MLESVHGRAMFMSRHSVSVWTALATNVSPPTPRSCIVRCQGLKLWDIFSDLQKLIHLFNFGGLTSLWTFHMSKESTMITAHFKIEITMPQTFTQLTYWMVLPIFLASNNFLHFFELIPLLLKTESCFQTIHTYNRSSRLSPSAEQETVWKTKSRCAVWFMSHKTKAFL